VLNLRNFFFSFGFSWEEVEEYIPLLGTLRESAVGTFHGGRPDSDERGRTMPSSPPSGCYWVLGTGICCSQSPVSVNCPVRPVPELLI
jgi:hypothetical protein